jgi:uncharacterized membrane protein
LIHLALLLIGVTAGLRALTPPAALSLGAFLLWIDLSGTWAAFVGHVVTLIVLVVLMIGEMIRDQMTGTPSRKARESIVLRSLSGAVCGVILGLPTGNWIAGLILGLIGAQIGTFGGYEVRKALAGAFGRDRPAALIEDAAAVVLALLAVWLA